VEPRQGAAAAEDTIMFGVDDNYVLREKQIF